MGGGWEGEGDSPPSGGSDCLGARMAAEASPWMLATVEGNTSDYNRQQGGTAAEYGYDVVLLRANNHPRNTTLHNSVIQRRFKKREVVKVGRESVRGAVQLCS